MSKGFPGWPSFGPSIGYHGDDGKIYESDKAPIGTGKVFAEGATIGCGINWYRESVYFLLNGERVGKWRDRPAYQAEA